MRSLAWIVGVLALTTTFGAFAQDPDRPRRGGRGDFNREEMRNRMLGPVLASTADRDRSGDVTQEEWTLFLTSIQGKEDGSVDVVVLKMQIFVASLDRDQNQVLETGDLDNIFAELDKNGDGTIQREELRGPQRQRGARGEGGEGRGRGGRGGGGFGRRGGNLAQSIPTSVVRTADGDRDSEITEDEWKTFITSLGADDKGVIPEEKIASLMTGPTRQRSEREGDGEGRRRGRRGGGFGYARMMAFMVGDDLTTENVNIVFASMDTNADGALQKEEMGTEPRSSEGEKKEETKKKKKKGEIF